MKNQRLFVISLMFLFLTGFVAANSMENFSQAEKLINEGVSCDQLTDEQLELIGDYYMEQMHSGEAHEYMDQMMGGEGSESLRQVHIAMAKRIYCNENVYTNYGMMGGNMMNGYMTGMAGYNYQPYTYGFNWLFTIVLALIITLLVILIFKQNERRRNGK